MSTAVMVPAVVGDGKVVICDEAHYRTRIKRACAQWGDGTSLIVRVESEDEAWRHSDCKHLYGHLYTPVSVQTGETVPDVHLRMKAAFFPEDGRTSLTQLDREEMRQFIEAVEQDIRETDPDSWERCLEAMALYERQHPQDKRTAVRG